MRLHTLSVVAAAVLFMGVSQPDGCAGERNYVNAVDVPADAKLKVGQEVKYKLNDKIHGFITMVMLRKVRDGSDKSAYYYEVRWLDIKQVPTPTTNVVVGDKTFTANVVINEVKEFHTIEAQDFELEPVDK